MTHGALGILDAILTFQNGADLEPNSDNLFSRFLRLEHSQDRTPNDLMRKRLLRFVDAVTGEVEDSVCQQIKLSAAYLKGG